MADNLAMKAVNLSTIKRMLGEIDSEGSQISPKSFPNARLDIPEVIPTTEVAEVRAKLEINREQWYKDLTETMQNWYEQGIMSDITIYAGEPPVSISTHKTILVAYSKFFDDLLMKDPRVTEVKLADINGEAMKDIMTWMYKGDIKITYKNCLDILEAATKLGCEALVLRADAVRNLFLKDHNLMNVSEVCEDNGVERLGELARIRLAERFYKIITLQQFLEWTIEQVEKYLSSDYIRVVSEIDVFQAASNWMNFRRNEREQYFVRLTSTVRWGWMSQDEYLKCVDIEPELTRIRDSKLKVTEANWYKTQENHHYTWEEYKKTMPSCRLIGMAGANKLPSFGQSSKLPTDTSSTTTLGRPPQNVGPQKVEATVRQRGVATAQRAPKEGGDGNEKSLYSRKKREKNLMQGKTEQLEKEALQVAGDVREYFPLPSQTIVVLGGHRGGSLPVNVASQVLMLDPKNGNWEQLVDMPTPLIYHSVVEINNDIYVMGGVKVAGNQTNVDLGKPQRSFWKLDSTSGQFITMPAMHRARHSGAAVSVYGMIHYMGGSSEKQKPTDLNEQFDLRSNTWEYSTHIPGSRSSPAACAYEDRIFLSGGIGQPVTDENGFVNVLSDMRQFSVYDSTWSELQDLPSPRCMGQMIEVDGLIYYIGGACAGDTKGSIKSCSEIWAFDPLINRWEVVGHLTKPRHSFGVAKVGHVVFVIGGVVTGSKIAAQDCEIFNTVRKTCQAIKCPLPTPRVGCAAVIIER